MIKQYIIEFNIGWLCFLVGDGWVVEFVNNFNWVNVVVECSFGFVWCLKDDIGLVMLMVIEDDLLVILNLLVWEDVFFLEVFVFQIVYKCFY